MPVTVTTNHQHETAYAAAEKWVIDDEDRLHIVGPKGNLASYARGVWAFVNAGTLDIAEPFANVRRMADEIEAQNALKTHH